MTKQQNRRIPDPVIYGFLREKAARVEHIVNLCMDMDDAEFSTFENAAKAIKLVRGLESVRL